MKRPKGMPPYPGQNRRLSDLSNRKYSLLTDMIFWEKSLGYGDFHDWVKLTKARKELKEINQRLERRDINY